MSHQDYPHDFSCKVAVSVSGKSQSELNLKNDRFCFPESYAQIEQVTFLATMLLTKHFSEMLILAKITNCTCNSSNNSFFMTGRQKGDFVKGWFWRMCPSSGFRSGGTCERTLVPVFVPGGTSECALVRVFCSGGTSDKTTLLENHPFVNPRFYGRFRGRKLKSLKNSARSKPTRICTAQFEWGQSAVVSAGEGVKIWVCLFLYGRS